MTRHLRKREDVAILTRETVICLLFGVTWQIFNFFPEHSIVKAEKSCAV